MITIMLNMEVFQVVVTTVQRVQNLCICLYVSQMSTALLSHNNCSINKATGEKYL
jgi:hypothetical protein